MNKKTILSTLWIFLTVNFIFCDVFSLHYHEDLNKLLTGKVGDTEITQEFLLIFAFIMEIPMLMILLSQLLEQKINRILNIIAGVLLIAVQTSSLLWGDNTLHYWFFSIIEIGTCIYIIWLANNWRFFGKNNEQKPLSEIAYSNDN